MKYFLIVSLLIINVTAYSQIISTPIPDDDIFRLFQVDVTPKSLNFDEIRKSLEESAKIYGVHEKIKIDYLVDRDGTVSYLGEYNGPDDFKNEFTRIVMKLLFKPAIFKEKEVKCWVTSIFIFH